MYKVVVNDEFNYDIEKDKDSFVINNEKVDWDIVKQQNGGYNIIWNNKVYNAEILKTEAETKSFSIKVNGNIYTVAVKDKYDLLLKELGLENLASSKVNEIKAPMPGLVLNIMVSKGQELKKGDSVLILEAMKMENVLKSPGDGIIKTIKVEQAQAVEKNQVLIELE